MATKLKGHWWGVDVKLTHSEACAWTDPTVQALGATLSSHFGGVWGSIIYAIIAVHKSYIRDKNELSGGKGVKIKMTWVGVYIGCERRGKRSAWGDSPCAVDIDDTTTRSDPILWGDFFARRRQPIRPR